MPQVRVVREEIDDADGGIDQDELINSLREKELSAEEVIESLHELMEQDEVSYNVDWDLETK